DPGSDEAESAGLLANEESYPGAFVSHGSRRHECQRESKLFRTIALRGEPCVCTRMRPGRFFSGEACRCLSARTGRELAASAGVAATPRSPVGFATFKGSSRPGARPGSRPQPGLPPVRGEEPGST